MCLEVAKLSYQGYGGKIAHTRITSLVTGAKAICQSVILFGTNFKRYQVPLGFNPWQVRDGKGRCLLQLSEITYKVFYGDNSTHIVKVAVSMPSLKLTMAPYEN